MRKADLYNKYPSPYAAKNVKNMTTLTNSIFNSEGALVSAGRKLMLAEGLGPVGAGVDIVPYSIVPVRRTPQ
jgi:hypothetical protein